MITLTVTVPDIIGKGQTVRLIDVFVLAPFMLYFGYKAQGITQLERYLMYGLGVSTLIYNANNYWWVQKAQQRSQAGIK